MTCKCGSTNIASLTAKCSDLCSYYFGDVDNGGYAQDDGYVPANVGIGGGDYIEFDYCLDCGQIQGKFPVKLELESEDDWE